MSENPWIPLEEILPEPYQVVLFWRTSQTRTYPFQPLPYAREITPGYIDAKGVIHMQFYRYDPSSPDAENPMNIYHKAPAFWMPVPDAPPGERYAAPSAREGT